MLTAPGLDLEPPPAAPALPESTPRDDRSSLGVLAPVLLVTAILAGTALVAAGVTWDATPGDVAAVTTAHPQRPPLEPPPQATRWTRWSL